MEKKMLYVALMISSLLISCGGDSSTSNKKSELKDVNKTSKKINSNEELRFSTRKIHKKYETESHDFEITIDYPIEGNESVLNNIRNWINLKCSKMCGETYSGDLSDTDSFTLFYTKALKQYLSDEYGVSLAIEISQEQAPNGIVSFSSSIVSCGASCGHENDAATFRIKDGHQLTFYEIFHSMGSYSWKLKDVLLLNKEEDYGYRDGDDNINVEDLSFALFPDRVMFVNRQSFKGSGRMNLKGSDLDDYLTDYGKKIMGIKPGFKIPSLNKLCLLYDRVIIKVLNEDFSINEMKKSILEMGLEQLYQKRINIKLEPEQTGFPNVDVFVFGKDAKFESIVFDKEYGYVKSCNVTPNGENFFVIQLSDGMVVHVDSKTWNKMKKEALNPEFDRLDDSDSNHFQLNELISYSTIFIGFETDNNGHYWIDFSHVP